MSRYAQRIPYVDPLDPQSWGRDDITGLPVMHQDLVKYYEYMGNGLQWTGLMTHYKDLDEPQPQLSPPKLRPDPVPIDNPRYLRLSHSPAVPNNVAVNNIMATTGEVTWTPVPGVDFYYVSWEAQWNSTYFQVNVAEPPYTIRELVPNSQYFVQVASVILVTQPPQSNGLIPPPYPLNSAFSYPSVLLMTIS